MTNETPHKENFKYATIILKIQKVLIVIGSLLSLSLFAKFFFDKFKDIVCIIDLAICLISIFSVISEIMFSYFYQKAGEEKIKDLVDNSLNSKLSDNNSKGYYTNDEISYGLPKLGGNNFESVFFTKSIVRKMIKKEAIFFGFVFFIYICSVLFLEKNILIIILQLLLPIQIMKEFITLCLFYSKVKDIYEDYKKIYSTTTKNKRVPYIIKNIILYEKLLSNYSIMLSSRIYRKQNDKLSKEWNLIKIRYHI